MVTADQNALCEKIAALADSMQPELLKFLEKAVNQDSGRRRQCVRRFSD